VYLRFCNVDFFTLQITLHTTIHQFNNKIKLNHIKFNELNEGD